MNTRVLVILSLFVGIGAALHAVVPPFLFGMKPDMSLAMMFLGIVLFPRIKYVIVLAVATGFVSALTTGFPLGQIPNIVEKPITAILFFGLFLLLKDRVNHAIGAPVLTAIGTLISGSLFLSIALFIVGVDVGAGFVPLFIANVLPAIVVNTMIMVVLYPVVQSIFKRSQPIALS